MKPNYNRPRSDEEYWGAQIARLVADPRNITTEEWAGELMAINEYLNGDFGCDDDLWQNAKLVAERIAAERGDIKDGPGENTVRLPWPGEGK